MRKLFDRWCADAAREISMRAPGRAVRSAGYLLESLENRRLLSATRLLDINPGVASSFQTGPTDRLPSAVAGGKLIFAATDVTSGRELWSTDGTPDNTKLLKNIAPETQRLVSRRPDRLGR